MSTSFLKYCRARQWALAAIVLSCPVTSLNAQDACRPPMPASIAKAGNIFNEQQETDLGDAMADHVQRNFRLSNNQQWTSYLNRIADRLLKHMPPTHLRVQIFLLDLPYANAFDAPGGRNYVSLKMVATARNEDEIAGILAHELGHLVTHQGAIDVSHEFKVALNVAQVSDRRDIFDKYNQLIDNAWRKRNALRHTRGESQEEQQIADRLALYAVAGAGYSTESFADIFDRTAGTEGKTGNWLTDFFGATNPESKRLREMINAHVEIPESCIDKSDRPGADQFKAWQSAVIDDPGWKSQELLHGVLSTTKLAPPLRGDLTNLKYSPDGLYVLAQDEGNIYVLTRQPFLPIFQIKARDAAPAQFTPDSSAVVFSTSGLRVEKWSIALRKRTSVHELIVQKGCYQSQLSPDGTVLSCLEDRQNLVLFDVAAGQEIFRKNQFRSRLELDVGFFFVLLELEGVYHPKLIDQHFSPDSHYFLAYADSSHLLFDLTTRQPVNLPGDLKKRVQGDFAFLGPDRLVAVDSFNPVKSHVLAFPSGEVQSEVSLGRIDIEGATKGGYLMVRPVRDDAVGVMDLRADKFVLGSKEPALDIFGSEFVDEMRDGQVGIFDVNNFNTQLARANLPGGDLGRLRAVAVSPDWKWLAASEAGRGAVWNLENGNRLYHVRGFHGAYFSGDSELLADFPKYKEKDREIAKLALPTPRISDGAKIEEKNSWQSGEFLVSDKHENNSKEFRIEKGTLEFDDVRTGTKLWSRSFPKNASNAGEVLLLWDASTSGARDEMKDFPKVQEKLSSGKTKSTSYFAELVDARSGKTRGALAVDLGVPFARIQRLAADGNWVAIADNQNRAFLYSISTGEETGRFFGNQPLLSAAGGLLGLENQSGHLTLYDLNSGEDLDTYVFSSDISFRAFSPDGKRLFVLTADQTVYVLDVSSPARQSVASTASNSK